MNLAWLVAILAPRDIAPHPNFSEKVHDGPSALAALHMPWKRYSRGDGTEDPLDAETRAYVLACDQALATGTMQQGTNKLAELVQVLSYRDPAQATAGALLAAAAFSELDQHDRALDILSTLIQTFRQGPEDAGQQLLIAALLQQQAFRFFEIGETGESQAQEAADLLRTLSVAALTPIKMSQSVSWGPEETFRSIIEALLDAASTHIAKLIDPLSPGWLDVVRSRPVELVLKTARGRAEGYEDYLEASFQYPAASTRRYSVSGPPGDLAVWQALLLLELLGHPAARRRRIDLGILRYLLSAEDQDVDLKQDALRLLRQGRDEGLLRVATRRIRVGGPLSALRGDAAMVLQHRAPVRRLGTTELILLEAASDLLSTAEASAALDAVLNCIERPFELKDRSWQAEAARLKDVWSAAVAIGVIAERLDGVAQRLLSEVARPTGDDDLMDRTHAEVIQDLDWSSVSAGTKEAWRRWATTATREGRQELLEAAEWHLDIRDEDANVSPPYELSIRDVATTLNGVIQGRATISDDTKHVSRIVVLDGLSEIRRDAAEGSYKGGGIAIADVAVGLAIYAGIDDVWEAIVDFLLDPKVRRADKDLALERLARESNRIPSRARDTLAAHVDVLFDTDGRDFFGDATIDPYPSALRLATALSILPEDRLLTGCARLAGAGQASTRVEAARTLTAIARGLHPPVWAVVLALQFSRDLDPSVRAEAARSLALLLPVNGQYQDLIVDRLLELLREDGILVPMLVLRGLTDVKPRTSLNRVTVAVIDDLAKRHAALSVRLQAGEFLAT